MLFHCFMPWWLFSYAWSFILLHVSGTSTDCNYVDSCQSQIITATDSVNCRANQACFNSTITTNSSIIGCHGSYSCLNSVLSMISNSTSLECKGLFSCKASHIRYNSAFDVQCIGTFNCPCPLLFLFFFLYFFFIFGLI